MANTFSDKLLHADLSELEMRVLATMTDVQHKPRDIHAKKASEIFGVPLSDVTPEQRRFGKMANMESLYGPSANQAIFGAICEDLVVPPFSFHPGQSVIYAVHGPDETYSDAARPRFLKVVATVAEVDLEDGTFKFEGDPRPNNIEHFETRTTMGTNEEWFLKIVSRMAIRRATQYEYHGSKDGMHPAERKEQFRKVAKQLRSGDYEIWSSTHHHMLQLV